jgi:DNA-binding CsgD family transcriptional regulator
VQLADELHPREQTMLRPLALGRSNREIGEALHLSPGTVKNYIVRLLDSHRCLTVPKRRLASAELGYLEHTQK